MAELIKTITDKDTLGEIFYEFFMKGDVYLKTKNGDHKIRFLGYADEKVALYVPYIKKMYEQCLAFVRSGDYTIYANLKLLEKQEDGSYIFSPLKIQIISSARRSDRRLLDMEGEGKSIVYIANILSDFIIQNSLSLEAKKVDRVKEIISHDAEKQFNMVKIFFCNEGQSDVRMKYFYNKNGPIFIPDIGGETGTKNGIDLNFYINNIYSKDYQLLNRKQLISEVSVPVLYKGKIPYGYVQVNHTDPLSKSHLSLVKRMSILVEELFVKYRLFPLMADKLVVSDVSKNGIGVVFKERRMIRYFKEGSYAYFDILLPGNKKSSCMGIIRNIKIMENKIIRVGSEIIEMDALSEVNFEEYCNTLGLS